MLYDVIILGSGPAGLTAAVYAARDNLKTLVVGGTKWGGQLMLTSVVENYPGFPSGILGPELMELFKKQAARFGAEIKFVDVTKVDFYGKPFRVWTDQEYQGKTVIIATGAETKWLGLANEQKLIGHGISSCAPCDAFFFRGKKVIVVGGGDSAMEETLTLAKFASEVTIVHRRDSFKASKIMQERVKALSNVKIVWNSEVVDILGEEKVMGVRIQDVINGKQTEMEIDGVFVAIGHFPNTKIFEGQVHLDQKGYVLRTRGGEHHVPVVGGEEVVHEHFRTMSSVAGVFVAGDVHDHHYKQAVTAAAYGCEAALEVGRYLAENFGG